MIVSPSILSADFGNLNADVRMLNGSAAQFIHIDVMDGVFVPNISFGFPVIKAVAAVAEKPLDVHMMTVNPDSYIQRLADLGAAIMNVHYEACTHLQRTVQAIREAGMLPAVTLNPATPVEMLTDIIEDVHMVLLMSVNPGFGGQKFLPRTLDKVSRLRAMIDSRRLHTLIEVDGGVNLETGALLAKAGADILVAGHSVFRSPDPAETIRQLSLL